MGSPLISRGNGTCQGISSLRRRLSELLCTGAARKMSFQESGVPLELGSSPPPSVHVILANPISLEA